MPKSNRTFGVEIEIDALDNPLDELQEIIFPDFHLTSDSSIIGDNPTEVVSGILVGSGGEKAIIEVCETLSEAGVDASGINSGLHVHLGAGEFNEKEQWSVQNAIEGLDTGGCIFGSFRAIRAWVDKRIDQKLTNEDYVRFFDWAGRNSWGRFDFISAIGDQILAVVKINNSRHFILVNKIDYKRIINIQGEDAENDIFEFLVNVASTQNKGKWAKRVQVNQTLDLLKNVLLTYVVFNDVISGMVPDSRKVGNSYCRRVSDTYTVDEILAVKTVLEFKKLWYLEDEDSNIQWHTREHYDNSRYQDVNLHSIWNRTNTIEIRSHKSTIEPKLIINWMRFHRHIVDCVVDGTLNQGTILPGTKLSSLQDKVLYLLDAIKADDDMRVYVKTLINHYNYLSL